jgi:sugar lactone lactonase YvrE
MADLVSKPIAEGFRFPEGPRWHDGRLYFSDQHDCVVRSMSPDGSVEEVVKVPEGPSGIGWMPDGTMLVVSMQDRKVMRFDGSTLAVHADLWDLAPWHCNDMVVDGVGRAYVGNFGFDLYTRGTAPVATNIVLVEPDGSARTVAEELRFPNGTVITPDGKTLIVGESWAGELAAFDIGADGSLSDRRLFAKLEGAVPDGICLDAEGAVWSACPASGRVVRVREGGRMTDAVTTSRKGAFACMLGGEDRRTLFICAADESDPDKTTERRGVIDAVDVTVPGAGWP